MLVAYFSMEFGVDVRLPIYSGGLGILAGDHLKAAAELGLPLVGIGLLLSRWVFHARAERGGPSDRDLHGDRPGGTRPAARAGDRRGRPGGRDGDRRRVAYDVGAGSATTVPLYLLDVDLVTDALYSGDREHRIRQELLLGVGGVRALAALGLEPTVFHVTRAIRRSSRSSERASSLRRACRAATRSSRSGARRSSRRTHRSRPGTRCSATSWSSVTPAPSRRGRPLRRDAARARAQRGHGRLRPDTAGTPPLGLRQRRLGAARRGGPRDVGGALAGSRPPIGHITNGVHLGTWLAPELDELLRSVGVRPEAPPADGGWGAVSVSTPTPSGTCTPCSRRGSPY